jgi:glycolate oxidase FAD binding subunit
MRVAASSPEEVADAVRGAPRVRFAAGATKSALAADADATVIDLSGLSGVLDYDPAELTFSALAGTPVAELEALLAGHGQYLPFEPPLAGAGATLGGTVATGLSGPGAFGAGGVRDFVCGVAVVDGEGRRFRAGGRVVKNAAGFDLAKLMVGSLGRLGAIVELSCKVFPRPPARATLACECGGLEAALATIARLARAPVRLEALELDPPGLVLARLGGGEDLIAARADRLAAEAGVPSRRLDDAEAAAVWAGAEAFAWAPAGVLLVRVPITPARLPALERELAIAGARRRYGRAANLAWVAWPAAREPAELDSLLARLDLAGVALLGGPAPALLGRGRWGGAFQERVRAALDPRRRFAEAA